MTLFLQRLLKQQHAGLTKLYLVLNKSKTLSTWPVELGFCNRLANVCLQLGAALLTLNRWCCLTIADRWTDGGKARFWRRVDGTSKLADTLTRRELSVRNRVFSVVELRVVSPPPLQKFHSWHDSFNLLIISSQGNATFPIVRNSSATVDLKLLLMYNSQSKQIGWNSCKSTVKSRRMRKEGNVQYSFRNTYLILIWTRHGRNVDNKLFVFCTHAY